MKKQKRAGSGNPHASLTELQILTIRKLYAEGSYKQIALAATFGISQAQISRIIRNHRWQHI